MAPRKPRKTKAPADHKQPETTPPVDPQTACPLFKLPPELRNMIYTYAFTLGQGGFFDRTFASANLGSVYYKLYTHPPSSSLRIALLRTCRRINTEATSVFATKFSELTLVVDVSTARKHMDNYVLPRLDEDQMSRLKRIVVIVDFWPPSTGWQHYVEQFMPCGTPYWARDRSEASEADGLVEGYEGYEGYMAYVHPTGEQLTLKMRQYHAIIRAGNMEYSRLRRAAGWAEKKRGKRRKARY
jgi:hypothetical protein